MKFSDRSKFIKENLSNLNNIVVVPTFEIHSAEDTDGYFERFLEEGYEGAIIRGDEPYEHKRSKNLLKYKRFQDDEFEILDVKAGKNNTIAESVTIRLNNGNICSATLAFPDDKCKEMLENKNNYIGKMATVCYFGMTNDKLLRFPIVKAIRDYE
jgi:DNA ligase-1